MTRSLKILAGAVIIVASAAACSVTYPAVPEPGSYQVEDYIDIINGKSIAIVANQTSMIGDVHIVDSLMALGADIKLIFAPEHGFRDLADAGESISDGRDLRTGIPIVSLYGSHLKPSGEDLTGIDIVIFDVQDVGARFYTYISTLHYVMEACAENDVECIVFDRPNPNGFYFDGNINDTAYRSFVGMHPVPVVHGMTVGEYARMINGEGWLHAGLKCELMVIRCSNYDHSTFYHLPVRPSPNLPNMTSVYLYPSLCFFEGTNISLGRGTPFPFQVFGSPEFTDKGFSFTPESLPGAMNPPLLGVKCYGRDLRDAVERNLVPAAGINLSWLIDAYNEFPDRDSFFIPYFDILAGGPLLREQIESGMTEPEIKTTWEEGLEEFGKLRKRYLLYK